jgi:hypothetical protein
MDDLGVIYPNIGWVLTLKQQISIAPNAIKANIYYLPMKCGTFIL